MAHYLARTETQAQGCFGLAFFDRFNACTEDLCQIGTIVKAQADNTVEGGIERRLIRHKTVALQRGHHLKGHSVWVETNILKSTAYAKSPQEQLYENRGPANNLHIDKSDPTK